MTALADAGFPTTSSPHTPGLGVCMHRPHSLHVTLQHWICGGYDWGKDWTMGHRVTQSWDSLGGIPVGAYSGSFSEITQIPDSSCTTTVHLLRRAESSWALPTLQSSSTTEQGEPRLGSGTSCDGQRRLGLKDVSEKSRWGLHSSLEPSGA